jgi:ABC-type nitrate/sulfonate/bicarbonate transport system permease component
MNLSWVSTFINLYFPYTLPYLLSGCRNAIGIAWMTVIAAEMIAASEGLGYFIEVSRIFLLPAQVLSAMIIIGCIGVVLLNGIRLVETKFTSWRPISYD